MGYRGQALALGQHRTPWGVGRRGRLWGAWGGVSSRGWLLGVLGGGGVGTWAVGCVNPDKSLKCFGFRTFSRAIEHADSKYGVYFYVRCSETRAHFVSKLTC